MKADDSGQNVAPARMTARQRRRSMNCARVGAIHALITGTCLSLGVMSLLALKLGANELYLGLLSFAILGTWIFRVFTMSAVEKYGKKNVMLFWKSISTLCIIPLFFLPLVASKFSSAFCLVMLFIVIFVRGATYALGNTGWFPLLQDIVPRRITGRFFANLRTLWQTSSLITMLLIALLLGTRPDWWKFEIIFAAAFIAFAIRVLTILPMTESPLNSDNFPKTSMWARFREVFSDPQLCRLVFYISTYMFAAIMAEPFKIKFLRDLGYSYGFILVASAMGNLSAIISLRFWGKLADRFGNHSIFTISHLAVPLFTVPWIFVAKGNASAVLAMALFFMVSVFNSGNGIAQTRYLLHAVSTEKQNQINVINVIISIAIGIAPVIAGVLLKLTEDFSVTIAGKTFNNYHGLFILSSILFIIPHILRRKLKLKNDTSTPQVIAFVTRPLRNIFGPFIRITRRPRDRPFQK